MYAWNHMKPHVTWNVGMKRMKGAMHIEYEWAFREQGRESTLINELVELIKESLNEVTDWLF